MNQKRSRGESLSPAIARRLRVTLELFSVTLSLLVIYVGASGGTPFFDVPAIWRTVLLGVGTSLLAGTFASVFENYLGPRAVVPTTDAVDERLEQLGLADAHLNLSAAGNDIKDRIKDAVSLDLMFNTGRFVMANYRSDIEEAFRRHGCQVRLLISSPDSPAFGISEFHRGLSPTHSLKGEVEETLAIAKDEFLTQMKAGRYNRRASLHVRLAPCIMTGSYLFINGTFLRFTPYLPYTRSSEIPVYDIEDVRGDCLFKQYKRVFERVWEEAAPQEVVAYPEVATPQRAPQ